jgi:hypothetical protein
VNAVIAGRRKTHIVRTHLVDAILRVEAPKAVRAGGTGATTIGVTFHAVEHRIIAPWRLAHLVDTHRALAVLGIDTGLAGGAFLLRALYGRRLRNRRRATTVDAELVSVLHAILARGR